MRTVCVFALSVICFTNASSPKGRAEKPVRISCPYAQSKLVSPSGRDVAQRQRGLESAGMAFQTFSDTGFFYLAPKTKTEHLSILCLLVGGGGFAFLRKSHAGCNMHPACCQEPAFESTAPILNLEGKTKESTDLYSLLWWEVVDSNHRSR